MNTCMICGNKTNDSDEIYQADFLGAATTKSKETALFVTSEKTTTVKTYKNVIKLTKFCCKNCRRESRELASFWLILLAVCSGLTAFCVWGGPWNENLPDTAIFQLINLLCVLGVICNAFFIPGCAFMAIAAVVHPYSSIQDTVLKHLNRPGYNNGHVYLTKEEGDKLRPVP